VNGKEGGEAVKGGVARGKKIRKKASKSVRSLKGTFGGKKKTNFESGGGNG